MAIRYLIILLFGILFPLSFENPRLRYYIWNCYYCAYFIIMKKKHTYVNVFLLLLFTVSALSGFSQVSVLTQHNNLYRTGWNNKEIILNTKNVNRRTFGAMFSRTVDDQIYAQPLVVLNAGLPVVGNKNIIIVATVNNSVYAFDADSANVTNPYWQVNLSPLGSRAVKNTDMTGACGGNYLDFSGNMGIIGTPVIDSLTNTMYVVSKSVTPAPDSLFQQYLHAIDIITGDEMPNSPILITAQMPGTGDGSVAGILPFNSQTQLQRAGLLLLNGIVYITWASYCDWNPYHGWVIGYDKTSLQQEIVYNTTPNGNKGGIWMSAAGPSADEAGNIYLAVGNGSVGVSGDPSDIINRSESALKLTPTGSGLAVSSFFTPENFPHLDAFDKDFGVTGMLLIPNSNRVITGGKDGKLYVLDRDNMGGYSSTGNNVVQTINVGTNQWVLRSSLAYYKGEQKEYIYSWSEKTLLHAFPFNRPADTLDVVNAIIGEVPGPRGGNGSFFSLSSNSSIDSTAVLWVNQAANGANANNQVRHGVIRAFSATDVTKELWNSAMNVADDPGDYSKFNCPTISNGKVYLATFSNKLMAYGLKEPDPMDTCNSVNIALNKPAVASTVAPGLDAYKAFDGTQVTRWGSYAEDTQSIYVDLRARYDLCEIVLKWEVAFAKDFQIQVSEDAVNWNTIKTVTGNINIENYFPLQGSGRYVRMLGTKRGTAYGYSIREFEVYGNLSGNQINGSADICPGTNTTLTANVVSNTYQWQVNKGSGFQNISNNSNYSGANTRKLQLNNVSSSWYGYQYHCILADATTNSVTLTFTNSWTGAVNESWEEPNNWSCGSVPDAYTDVFVNTGTVIVDSNPTIRSLNLKTGVNFKVNSGKVFTVNH